jgi:hypothetical protein
VFRATLALGAAMVAGSIPTLLSSTARGPIGTAGAVGGALTIFVLVFFYDPMRRASGTTAVAAGLAALPAAGAESIFISYRRSETTDVVGRLHEHLEQHFGAGTVFKDVNDITPGLMFEDVLADALARCKVAIIVIGPEWEELLQAHKAHTAGDRPDYVVFEITRAFARHVPVIPLLVQRTTLPDAGALPSEVANLHRYQTLQLRPDPDFPQDANRLIQAIETLLKRPPARAAAATAGR